MSTKITTAMAAKVINASPQFVRVAMQRGLLPIGTACKMTTQWSYNISPGLLASYIGIDVDELERRLISAE